MLCYGSDNVSEKIIFSTKNQGRIFPIIYNLLFKIKCKLNLKTFQWNQSEFSKNILNHGF